MDETTPGLPDPADVRACLRDACGADVALERLEPRYVKAGPGGTLRVLYEGPGPRGQVLRLAARRVDAATGRRLAARINERFVPLAGVLDATGFTRPAIHAPALDLLFQVFPADPRLPGLPLAVDVDAMAPVLEAALAARTGGARLRDLAVEVARYKPERKCLLRYDLGWTGGRAQRCPPVVYAKVARPRKFEHARAILPALWAARPRAFELPEPLGFVPDVSMELFSHLPGVVLFALVEAERYPALCERVGLALHEFHTLPVAVGPRWDVRAQIERLAASAVEFAWLFPAAARRIAALHVRLAAALAALPEAPPRLVHRDFHGDNVLVDGMRIAFIDLEDCARGDPADDVGSNWAQLTWHVLRVGARSPVTAAGRRAFLAAYLERCDAVTAARIPIHAALHCFLHGHQCLRHPRDPGRYADAEAMLATCARVLATGRAGDLASGGETVVE